MPFGLYISAEGAMAQSLRMETVANNLANVDTLAFKRDLAVFQARYAEAVENGQDPRGSGSLNDLGGGVDVLETKTDYSPGPLKPTRVETDMAIDGGGFFAVERNGQMFLTRAGNFRVDPDGKLVTQAGDSVLSSNLTPIVIEPELGPWQLSEDGGIRQAGTVTPLALLQPASAGDLVKAGDNLFSPLAPAAAVPAAQRRVLGGHLEQSGVTAVHEMTEMIATSRAFEANVNMIRNQDQVLGALVSRVLRV